MSQQERLLRVLRAPHVSEKATNNAEKSNTIVFKVAVDANKVEIKKAIEEIFNVKVVEIRTVNVHRKPKRLQRYEGYKAAYKKAIVRLAAGQSIDVFET